MTQSKVEEVAASLKQAIMESDYRPWSDETDPTDSFRVDGEIDLNALARAAIAAMREPTEKG